MPSEKIFIDANLIKEIVLVTLPNAILLFIVAILFFIYLPRHIFPQRYAGGGLENIISNILYMLAYVELVVPLMVFLKIFSLTTFLTSLLLTKILFFKFYYKRSLKPFLSYNYNQFLIKVFDFFDEKDKYFEEAKRKLVLALENYFLHLSFYHLLYRFLFLLVFVYLIYTLGYRCFISLSNPLPDTTQFIEWVATLHKNILYADGKTAGADFYGISIFIFTMQVLTNIDSIVLFNIYPLLLISFLLLGVYFVAKRFTLSSLLALSTLMIYGIVLLGSPLNSFLITGVAPTTNPEIIDLFGLKFYTLDKDLAQAATGPNFDPYLRYFSGMAYEFASAFFLLNLFYLIKAVDRGQPRHFLNYTLSLMLVFIFHGGGAIALIVPSLLIALNATITFKLNWKLLKKGLKAIFIAAILGNGWMLSVLKYGIPQDFGAAAPFLDRLFGTKQAVEDLVATGLEEVTISVLTPIHLYYFLYSVALFLIAFLGKRKFYFSSFLLIPIGIFLIYFAENLGFSKLIHQGRAAEYLLLATTILVACTLRLIYLAIKLFLGNITRYLFLGLLYIQFFLLAVFVPHYKDSEELMRYVDRFNYSDVSMALYKIIKENRLHTWTVVAFSEEYSKVLNKGFFINSSDFVRWYDPTDRYLPIPSQKIYIFIEDIPHRFHESDDWYYRWRSRVMTSLKSWVSIYQAFHNNIRVFYSSNLVTVYEIDNSEYLEKLAQEEAQ
ncbi:MAG: hypothetical protein GXO61_00630 [Epsilonproteobacteria bacterium]|nr:hypothetical protein [Campylobacterota bacterium]